MVNKNIYSILILFAVVLTSCNNLLNDICSDDSYPKNAKLKRILLYNNIDSKEPISITEEFEYNEDGKISRISIPYYEDGELIYVIEYKQFIYNDLGQLIEKKDFSYNANSGYRNLKNCIYTYSDDGYIEKELIEYPIINSFDYSLYEYNSNNLVKIIRNIDSNDKLISYTSYTYDGLHQLTKELEFGANELFPTLITKHYNFDGLKIKTKVFSGNDTLIRKIYYTYDINNNLITKEQKESMHSSVMSHVLRYEYYDE